MSSLIHDPNLPIGGPNQRRCRSRRRRQGAPAMAAGLEHRHATAGRAPPGHHAAAAPVPHRQRPEAGPIAALAGQRHRDRTRSMGPLACERWDLELPIEPCGDELWR